jgi:hypothetical protein
MNDPTPTGRVLLREYLATHAHSTHSFCREHRLDYPYTLRVLSGERGQRVSVDYALAIQAATAGAVPVESWRSEDA